jgi:hypothetical protein
MFSFMGEQGPQVGYLDPYGRTWSSEESARYAWWEASNTGKFICPNCGGELDAEGICQLCAYECFRMERRNQLRYEDAIAFV